MSSIKPLEAAQLYRPADLAQLDFSTTDDLENIEGIIGQARAMEAIQFGIGIRKHGYNIFAFGPSGTGKQGIVTQLLSQQAASASAPHDWCYVNNFDQPHKPVMLCLPAGQGRRLSQDMWQLVEELREAIPALFESDEYRNKLEELENALKQRQEDAVDEIRQAAKKDNIALLRTAEGYAFAPMQGDKVMGQDEYKALSAEARQKFDAGIEVMQNDLETVLRQFPKWRRETRETLKRLNHEVVMSTVGHLLDELRETYTAHPGVLAYLEQVQDDIIANVSEFRRNDTEESASATGLAWPGSAFNRYLVNVLVDHSTANRAPLVYEDNPTYQNLVGRIENIAMMGTLVTDFSLIKPGALHRANGGYLILEANKLLQQPFSWEALKRVLRSREIHIRSLEQMYSLGSTVSLEPEPVPLDIKVVLVGDRALYYMLYQLDPEFQELFKVAADFDDQMDRGAESQALYARLIATLVKKESLQPFDRSGVARVIEFSARITDDAAKLSTHMRSICDLLCEADYRARQVSRGVVTALDVQAAINARIRRGNRLEEHLHDNIRRGILLMDTGNAVVGQINGLTVIDLGNASFGMPVRITAQARLGDGDVIDIEREVELGGPIHSKGVLILSGFLGARYAREQPLALSASLVFEQSYAEVEGDSASAAELFALLSALAGAPLKQGVAVTGSVDQRGNVQAIGGVNEKIEGFFDVCSKRGLNGEQGVLIPGVNVHDLMLRADVVDAVQQGKFNIYAIRTIDEGMELLTGMSAGEMNDAGQYPEGSINYRVAEQLLRFAEIRHEFGEARKESGDGEHDQTSH